MIDSVVNSIEASSLNLNGIVLLLLGIKIISYRNILLLGACLCFLAYAVQVFFLKSVEFINFSILMINILVGVIILLLYYIRKGGFKFAEKSKIGALKNYSNKNDI